MPLMQAPPCVPCFLSVHAGTEGRADALHVAGLRAGAEQAAAAGVVAGVARVAAAAVLVQVHVLRRCARAPREQALLL